MPATSVSEPQLVEALRRVPPQRWPDVLDLLQAMQAEGQAASNEEVPQLEQLAALTWTGAALRQWPLDVQDAVLRTQAARLVELYRANPQPSAVTWWTPREIAHLPPEQRRILLEASATVAEVEYRTNPELTTFDAFGDENLYDHTPAPNDG